MGIDSFTSTAFVNSSGSIQISGVLGVIFKLVGKKKVNPNL